MNSFLKCECPHSGLHIEYAATDGGRDTECPECSKSICLPAPATSPTVPQRWVIVDTETDGLAQPIHVVEIAAQLMEGWDKYGEPFQAYLNHNVHIPIEATAIHG